jgi:hypothetical protein
MKLLEMGKLGGGTLENLIQSCRLFQCSNPRDRIYGILGLLRFPNHAFGGHVYLNPEPPAGWELPVVDYTKTTAQLYLDIMSWCIKGGSLNILKLSQHLQEALECPFEGPILFDLKNSITGILKRSFLQRYIVKNM